MISKLNLISAGFLCLIPFSLVTGPFLPDLFVCLISFIFLIKCSLDKDFSFFKNKFALIFLFFYIYLILVSVFSVNPMLSLESSLFYFRFGIFCIAVYYLINFSDKVIYYFFIFTSIIFIVLAIDSIFQLIFGYNILGFSKPSHRLNSLFGDEHKMGSYLSRLFPLYLCLFFYLKDKIMKFDFFLFIIISLFILLIYSSGERTAFFLTLIFLFLFLFTDFGKEYRKKILLFTTSIVILTSFFLPITAKRMFTQTFNEFGFKELLQGDYNSLNFFTKLHTSHYEIGLKMFKDNIFFGQGTKNFRHLCNEPKFNTTNIIESCSTHPHNVYIQLLAETGLFGFAFFSFIFIYSIYLFIKSLNLKKLKNNKYALSFQIIIITVIINLWPLAPSNNFFNNWINVVYYLPIGFMIYFYKKSFQNSNV